VHQLDDTEEVDAHAAALDCLEVAVDPLGTPDHRFGKEASPLVEELDSNAGVRAHRSVGDDVSAALRDV
jgi:hypothetical protein